MLNGILPSPGSLSLYSYSEFYDANVFIGTNGRSLIPGFNAEIGVIAPRILYTYPVTVGQFYFTSGVIPTFGNINVSAFGRSGHSFGFTNFDVEPLYINYSNPSHTFFAYFGPDIYAPTANYDPTYLVNLGTN